MHHALLPPAGLRAGQYSPELLRCVVDFLRPLPAFEEVVVNCARKHDAKEWTRLFVLCGSPAQLCERCIQVGAHMQLCGRSSHLLTHLLAAAAQVGKLRIASLYLVLVRSTEGLQVCRGLAAQLLEAEQRRMAAAGTGAGSSRLMQAVRRFLATTPAEEKDVAEGHEPHEHGERNAQSKLPQQQQLASSWIPKFSWS